MVIFFLTGHKSRCFFRNTQKGRTRDAWQRVVQAEGVIPVSSGEAKPDDIASEMHSYPAKIRFVPAGLDLFP
jgi:hypothetical protein